MSALCALLDILTLKQKSHDIRARTRTPNKCRLEKKLKRQNYTPIYNRNGILTINKSLALGLEEGGEEARDKNSCNNRENLFASDSSGHLAGICKGSSMSMNGGSDSAISQTVAPADHTSTFRTS